MTGFPSDAHRTTRLLGRARQGSREALDDLLRHVWPKIEEWVRRERGGTVKSRFDTLDCAQDVALGLVQYLPNVVVNDSEAFHRILYRMIQNTMCNKHDYLMARRRRLTQERPLADDVRIELDPPDARVETPSAAVSRLEEQAWVRFGLALLKPEEQELVFRHQYDGESFTEIGAALDLRPDAVRMRFNRALARLNSVIGKLRRGQVAHDG